MKKNIIFILLLVFFVYSCGTKDADVDFYNLGTEMHISTDGMTSLDNEAVVYAENPLKNLAAIDVAHEGIVNADDEDVPPSSTDLGSITLSDGMGSITLSEAQLGISEQGWTANLMLNAAFDSKEINRPISISVDNPFSTTDPGITHRDDTTFNFEYEVAPVSATVSSVTIETKVGSGGTYSNVSGSWGPTGEVPFVGTDYNVGDTIFVRVTATAGSKSDSEVTELVISPVSYEAVDDFMLDIASGLAYDFVEAEKVATGTEAADIEITSTNFDGGFDLGFISNQNAEFVAVTSTVYGNGDIFVAENMDYSSAIKSVGALVGGETYVYRTMRGTDYSYGYIKVIAISKPNGVLADSYIEFEQKH